MTRLSLGCRSACAVVTGAISDRVKCWDDQTIEGCILGYGESHSKGTNSGEMGDTGDEFTCALFKDGFKCWGRNDGGQLGLDDTNQRGDEPSEMGRALKFVDVGGKVAP